MNSPKVTVDQADKQSHGLPSGWQCYFDALLDRNVPESARPWLARRAKAFVDRLQSDGRGLQSALPEDATGFLNAVSRSGALRDWQFRQCVQSIEILLRDIGQLPWAEAFDWNFWRQAASPHF